MSGLKDLLGSGASGGKKFDDFMDDTGPKKNQMKMYSSVVKRLEKKIVEKPEEVAPPKKVNVTGFTPPDLPPKPSGVRTSLKKKIVIKAPH